MKHQKIFEEKQMTSKENNMHVDLIMCFYHEPQIHCLLYSNPAFSEIATVFELVAHFA